MYLAASGAANAAAGSPDTLAAVSFGCAGVGDGAGGSAGTTSASLMVSGGVSGRGSGVTAVSLDTRAVCGGVTVGLTSFGFDIAGAGLLTLLALGGGGTTSGVGAADKMVRVVKAALDVDGRRFKDRLAESKSARWTPNTAAVKSAKRSSHGQVRDTYDRPEPDSSPLVCVAGSPLGADSLGFKTSKAIGRPIIHMKLVGI